MIQSKSLRLGALTGAIILGIARLSDAVTVTIGSPHFTDGSFETLSTLESADSGQPAPFNTFIGSHEGGGPNFSASWTLSYSSLPVTGAAISYGLYDGDSAAPGNQVALFSINGTDFTAAANTAMEGHGGTQSEYDIYNVTLPGSVFSSLGTGTAVVDLTLQGPGLQGDAGTTDDTTTTNGAELDFSTLTLNNSVPEPTSLMALGLVPMVIRRRRGQLS